MSSSRRGGLRSHSGSGGPTFRQLYAEAQRRGVGTVLLPQLLDACSRAEINNIGRQLRYAIHDERGETAD